jgi:hypothetical protein
MRFRALILLAVGLVLAIAIYLGRPERDLTKEPGGASLKSAQPRPIPSAGEAFEAWMRAYQESPNVETVREGVELATQRRAWMRAMIENDPEQALAVSISRAARQSLPQDVQMLLETPIDATGTLAVVIACGHSPEDHLRMGIDPDLANQGGVPSHGTWRDAVIGDQVYRAHVYGRRKDMLTLENVPLHGMALDGHMAVSAWPYRRVEMGEAAASPMDVVVQVGDAYHKFPTVEAAAAFEAAVLDAEARADGPRVSYPAPQ